jgi:hypothetical protein
LIFNFGIELDYGHVKGKTQKWRLGDVEFELFWLKWGIFNNCRAIKVEPIQLFEDI